MEKKTEIDETRTTAMGMTDGTVDVLAVGAHRDDCEIMAGGTLIKMIDQGYRVGILDLTQGEMGTRGDPGNPGQGSLLRPVCHGDNPPGKPEAARRPGGSHL